MFVNPLMMHSDLETLKTLVEHLQTRIEALENAERKTECQEDNMSKLTTKARKKLPKKDFGLPGERKYPVEDKSHAKNALARVSQQEKKGNISKSSAAKVRAKARKKLKE